MKILLLSRYDTLGASSRYRSYQYLPYLRSRGHTVQVAPLLSNLYLQRLYAGKSMPVFDVFAALVHRKLLMLQKRKFDLLWIEYEALPWIPYWMESMLLSSSVPFVLDYDDAIFHRYDRHPSAVVRAALGKKIDHLMNRSSLVIAGNEYLASRAREAGAKRVEILPTVIDLEKYPVTPAAQSDEFTIGWIGTPKTVHYLNEIREALQVVGREGGARVVTIGAEGVELSGVHCEHRLWSEKTEVEEMQKFDVGVMPLIDGPWERGKCGHKLIQYMGCSRPVVASPVGVNSTIVEEGKTGFLASTTDQWVRALRTLKENRSLRLEMGRKGRGKVEQSYSLQVAAPRLASLLEEFQKGKR
ncbi:MAG: glycosyltransferase family 4 protein [Ignavibacteriales bacterium]|nr:glycosyltransferase family 4 protein [Ignavibacteriales bacterium]